jgi:hypothetical protein
MSAAIGAQAIPSFKKEIIIKQTRKEIGASTPTFFIIAAYFNFAVAQRSTPQRVAAPYP